MNSSRLTLRATSRTHVVSTAFETIAKALLYWNSRILLFRSNSRMLVALGKIRDAFPVHYCQQLEVCVLDFAIGDDFFVFVLAG